MGIIFGLVAALTWGVADFCARFAAHKIGNFRTVFYMQLVGFAGLSLVLVFLDKPGRLDWGLLGLTVVLAGLNALAVLFLYRSFEIGKLAVVSPIAAAYGAITLVLGLLSGQRPSFFELAGLGLIVLGVTLASSPLSFKANKASKVKAVPATSVYAPYLPKKAWTAQLKATIYNGVAFAVMAALLWGLVFWGLGFVTPTLGASLPVWIMRAVAPFAVFGLAQPLQQSLKYPDTKTAWLWVLGVAVFDTAAYVFYGLGLQLAASGIVAVLASLFSAVTVVLAWLFIREKLAANQWFGILLILAGIALVGGLLK